jgi:capsular exopolysaccharide synthesis family protein
MSRIQDILNKAERDGTVRRTRGLGSEGGISQAAAIAPAAIPQHRPAVPEPPPMDRHESRGWTPPPPSDTENAPARETREQKIDHHLVAALAPQSLAAEQYRSLRTRISRAENGRAVRTIIVTSPSKGDGKSLTAANLALTMAQEYQHRVLLLDADLRRPTLHQLFGIVEAPGLTDVLMGGATLDDALVPLADHHLTVLPSGVPATHPAELLGSAAMRRTLDALRTRFDRVILDMPPVSPLADVHIVAAMADGLLMIVRAGVTAKPAIERALAGLDTSKVLGLVLNETGGDDGSAEGYGGYAYVAG